MSDVTQILSAIEQGDPDAAEQLLPLVYEELRKLAAQKMAHESPDHTLQATALVHEAYIRLVDVEKAQHWDSQGHFYAAAAEAMRLILIELARAISFESGFGDTSSDVSKGGVAAADAGLLILDSHVNLRSRSLSGGPHVQQILAEFVFFSRISVTLAEFSEFLYWDSCLWQTSVRIPISY